jgi:hypothetical protein
MAFGYFEVAVRSPSLYWNAFDSHNRAGASNVIFKLSLVGRGSYGLAEILAKPRFTLLSTWPMPPHLRTPGPAALGDDLLRGQCWLRFSQWLARNLESLGHRVAQHGDAKGAGGFLYRVTTVRHAVPVNLHPGTAFGPMPPRSARAQDRPLVRIPFVEGRVIHPTARKPSSTRVKPTARPKNTSRRDEKRCRISQVRTQKRS